MIRGIGLERACVVPYLCLQGLETALNWQRLVVCDGTSRLLCCDPWVVNAWMSCPEFSSGWIGGVRLGGGRPVLTCRRASGRESARARAAFSINGGPCRRNF